MWKECTRCNAFKELHEFHKQKGGLYDRHSQCRECRTQPGEYSRRPSIEDTQSLRCSGCKEHLETSMFYEKVGTKRGYSSRCRECLKQRRIQKQTEWTSNLEQYLLLLIQSERDEILDPQTIQQLLQEQEFLCFISKHQMTYQYTSSGSIQYPWNISIMYDEIGNPHLVCKFIRTLMDEFHMNHTTVDAFYNLMNKSPERLLVTSNGLVETVAGGPTGR
jgi:hypothetical protein